jgi:membrane protein DedA with SNARE-associated domain
MVGGIQMHHDIHYYLAHYSYGGVFIVVCLEMIGIPFPAETTLTVAGFAINKALFVFIPLVLVATLANITGSTIAYGIGRFFGRTVILRFGRRLGVTEERLAKAEETMERYRIIRSICRYDLAALSSCSAPLYVAYFVGNRAAAYCLLCNQKNTFG